MVNSTSISCIVTIKCGFSDRLIRCSNINCSTVSLSKIVSEFHIINASVIRWGNINCSTISSTCSIRSIFGEGWIFNCPIITFSIVDCSTKNSRILSEISIFNCSIWITVIDCTTTIGTWCSLSSVIGERWTYNWLVSISITTIIVNCTTRSTRRILSEVWTFNGWITWWSVINCTTKTGSSISGVVNERSTIN